MRPIAVHAIAVLLATAAFAQDIPTDPIALIMAGRERAEAVEVVPNKIYQAVGFGNSFLVTTDEGNVLIDTSLAAHAPHHKKLLTAVSDAPVKYIILTHGHGDHRGGVALWKGDGTEVIAQENYVEFLHYQARLAPFFAERNRAQFGGRVPIADTPMPEGNFPAEIDATILFDDAYTFTLGGLTFECHATPGETYDHLSVWIPELKAAFVGDNFYGSFPNMYTLRGTKPRWALDYVASINTVMSWQPELVLPSHGMAVRGNDEIVKQMTRYRDAILYVHDATVRGMNEGQDVYTLMRAIRLPEHLDVGEGYGTLAWTVRGIYEGYAGYFDGDPATMYPVSQSAIYDDLVELAGANAVVERAKRHIEDGNPVEALHLANVVLENAPEHEAALRVRLEAFESLLENSANFNENGWLQHGINETRKRLKE